MKLYKHDSFKSGKGYFARVLSHEVTAEIDEDGINYVVRLPYGSCLLISSPVTIDQAIQEGIDCLKQRGWVEDHELALRRAQHEADLREAGILRFKGPKSKDLKRCQVEIMTIN